MRRAFPILILLSLVALSGCYERVVGAKGMGAQGVTVTQPNGPESSKSSSAQKKTVRLKEAPSRW